MGCVFGYSNDTGLLVLRELDPFVVFGVPLCLYYAIINIMRSKTGKVGKLLPAALIEKGRDDALDETATLVLDLILSREASGRKDRAIEAIVLWDGMCRDDWHFSGTSKARS